MLEFIMLKCIKDLLSFFPKVGFVFEPVAVYIEISLIFILKKIKKYLHVE